MYDREQENMGMCKEVKTLETLICDLSQEFTIERACSSIVTNACALDSRALFWQSKTQPTAV